MDLTRIKKIQRLLREQFPKYCAGNYLLMHGSKPTAEGVLLLPSDPSKMTTEALAAQAYHSELLCLSEQALNERIAAADLRQQALRRASHPFNVPDAMADDDVFDYWCKAAFWSLEEGVALLLRRDPAKVIRKTRGPNEASATFKPSTCGPEYETLYELARRASLTGQLSKTNIPGFFLAWASRNRIEVPERLVSFVELHGQQVADWKTAYDLQTEKNKALEARVAMLERALQGAQVPSKPPSAITRERNTLLKIILGLAMDTYGYQPHSPRGATAGEISGHLDGVGLSVSEDTVRKYLAEAAEFAPPREV